MSLRAERGEADAPPEHFVGYGGVELFGRIPHFTENRFMKWYKGILGQRMRSRSLPNQGVEVQLASNILKTMTSLGRPVSYRVA